jgi:hypothetical protein
MSIRMVQSVRLSSFLHSVFAVTSTPSLPRTDAHIGPPWPRAALVRPAAGLLMTLCALSSFAAAQTAHFSGARSRAAGGPGSAVANAVHSDQAPAAANFGTAKIGATSAAMTLTFTFDEAVTLGSTSVVTQGAPNLDFADAGTGTCTVGTAYAANATCTVDATFTPGFSGTLFGAAVLFDNSGNVIATAYLQGTGSGPQVNFLPGTETKVVSGWDQVGGMFAAENGDIYIANNGQNYLETPSAGGYVQSEVNINGRAGQIALDGAGNFYIGENIAFVYKETPLSTGGYAESTLGNGLSAQSGQVVDGGGNVYISDALNGRVLLETPSAGNYTQSVIYTCGDVGVQSCPSDVAVDASGKVFISAYWGSQIFELTPIAGGGYTQSTVGSGLVWPSSVNVDGNGNLYIADTLNNRIVKETLTAGGYIQSTVQTASGLDWPWGAIVDWSGNVYIYDHYLSEILKEDHSDPPNLNFTSTNNGPQTVTIENNGNEPLIFPVPSTGTNPSISGNFTLDSSAATACPLVSAGASSPGTLAVNASCTLTISPSGAGTFSGSLVLTDTNLNAPAPAYATQTIALAAAVPSQVKLSASAAKVQVGQPFTLTATVVVPSGGATPTGQVTFAGVGTPAPVVTLNASGVATFTSSTLARGTYSVTASYSGDSNYLGGSSNAVAFTVTGYASQTTLNASSTQLQAGQSLTLTATVTGASGSAMPTGNVTFSGVGSPSPSAALNGSGVATWTSSTLAAGNYAATASYPGDATHDPSTSQPVYFSVAAGPPANIIPVGGPNWTAQYGHGTNICAEVTDANGNELAGVPVTFSGTGLAFTPSPATSNTSGQACTVATPLGAASYVATASVAGVSSTATFNLTVTPAPLIVIVSPDSIPYGTPNPNFTSKVRGLVNGDTLGGTVIVTVQTTATPASPVDFYPLSVTLSGASAAGYTAHTLPAMLHVRQAELHIWPATEPVTYGQTPAAPTGYLLTGFVNGDTAGVVSGAPVLSTTVTSTTPAGVYHIDSQAGTLTSANYRFVPQTGVIQVYPAPLTLTANNVTMTQGSAVPPLTYTLAGFVNGDTASVVTGAPLLTTTATSSSPPGTYPITVWKETLSAENYYFIKIENGGVVTVTP